MRAKGHRTPTRRSRMRRYCAKLVCVAVLISSNLRGQETTCETVPLFTESQRKAIVTAASKLTPEDVAGLSKRADANDIEAQVILCYFYSNDSVWGVRWCRKPAERAHPMAEDILGALYMSGNGVDRNAGEAVRLTRMAAEQGYAAAEANLARYYSDGSCIQHDDKLAVEWARKAAEQGNPNGENLLGWSYISGKGGKRDEQEGIRWFRLAAEQGFLRAQLNMAWAYEKGVGVKKDTEEARRWSERAASAGSAFAALRVAALYYWHGWFNHHHDYSNSYTWFLIADRLKSRSMGSEDLPPEYTRLEGKSPKLEQIVGGQMSSEEKAHSAKVADNWLRNHFPNTQQ
jgi:TPR repeat protein